MFRHVTSFQFFSENFQPFSRLSMACHGMSLVATRYFGKRVVLQRSGHNCIYTNLINNFSVFFSVFQCWFPFFQCWLPFFRFSVKDFHKNRKFSFSVFQCSAPFFQCWFPFFQCLDPRHLLEFYANSVILVFFTVRLYI